MNTKLQNMFEIAERQDDGKYKFVPTPDCSRKDLSALLLLDKLQPAHGIFHFIIGSSGHDKIYLGINDNELEKVITQEQVTELYNLGVYYEEEQLVMYV